jgi:hypothetical protein
MQQKFRKQAPQEPQEEGQTISGLDARYAASGGSAKALFVYHADSEGRHQH